MARHDMGLIGCGVMGQNLALNIAGRGYSVAVYDEGFERVQRYLAGRAAGREISAAKTLGDLARVLRRPRRVLLMVPAGKAVDECIERLLADLEAGDILVDGGNSHYNDTSRRAVQLEVRNVHYIGAGISGGEEGALRGPSIMVGGSQAGWEEVKPILQAIAAETEDGSICCDWVGGGGAGHFVKMIHNGIEYGEMQVICEAYHLMRDGLEMPLDAVGAIFDEWNRDELASYLIGIVNPIVKCLDDNGEAVLEKILDVAGQKGTGKWALETALDAGQALTLTAAGVFSRFLSGLRRERLNAARIFVAPQSELDKESKRRLLEDLRSALYASRIVNHAQAYQLMRAVAPGQSWDLDFRTITGLWRAGCIIRSALLRDIQKAYQENPGLENLLLAPNVAAATATAQPGWRRAVAAGANLGVPLPAIGSALAFFDSYRSQQLPMNLVQAMRDYFGAHGYQYALNGQVFHRAWAGDGSETRIG